jgi:DNA repair exonuclease SbcCD ATPase subunit
MAENDRKTGSDGTATNAGAGGESLEKVRDILFGAQMRDQEKRFARVDERIAKETGDLREEIRRRLDSLEAYVKKEVQSLLERIRNEHEEREEADKELSQAHKETSKATDKRLGQLDDRLATAQRDLRQELLDQSKTLRDEVRQSEGSVTAALERSAGELRSEKLDRAALADLLNEMAVRLSGEDGAGT